MAGWVAIPPEELRPASASRIRQNYTGHSLHIPRPLDRGFPAATLRPLSAPCADEPSRKHREQARRPQLVLHVHLRENVIDINIGQGTQRVYWLGITACQRYLQEFDTYEREFAKELTPRGVLTAELELLDNHARLRDELKTGDHVWVDVGDGETPSTSAIPAPLITSRSEFALSVSHFLQASRFRV